MTEEKPDDIEEVSDGDLEEIKKEPEYKDASMPNDLWKTWLERRKFGGATTVGQGAGDASAGVEQESGTDKDWAKPVESQTYIGKPNTKGKDDESE